MTALLQAFLTWFFGEYITEYDRRKRAHKQMENTQ